MPIVGTAIGGLVGGALGWWLGKKGGEAVGGAAAKLVPEKTTSPAPKDLPTQQSLPLPAASATASMTSLSPLTMDGSVYSQISAAVAEGIRRAYDAMPVAAPLLAGATGTGDEVWR